MVGVEVVSVPDEMESNYEVVVVGGGAAGLSGALMLARARRSVLVIDAGEPRNAPAAGVHGFLSRDGIPPAELAEIGRTEVRSYGGRIVSARVTSATANDGNSAGNGFTVTLDDGRAVSARRLLVTTGLVDQLPDVPRLRERWGRDVLHCPYCHGWEIRDRAVGVLATGPLAVHQALLFRQWTHDVTLLLHTWPEPDETEAAKLAARDIEVVRGEVEALEVEDDSLTGVRLRNGRVVPVQAVTVTPTFIARGDVLRSLGLEPSPHPTGEFIASDVDGVTEVPGVWVAGNVTNLKGQVLASAAEGAAAAVAINMDLINEDVERAVRERTAVATAR